MSNRSPFIPPDPRNLTMRPLDKGIILNQSPEMVPIGGLVDCQNFRAGQRGLTRRPVYRRFESGTVDYSPIQEMLEFWEQSGNQQVIILDKKFLYELESGSFTAKYWTYSTGTITATSGDATIEGAGGMDWTASQIEVGDVIILDPDGSGNGPETHLIDSITDADTLEMDAVAANNHAAGTDYVIRRAFRAVRPYLVDAFPAHNKVYFSDGVRFPYTYDGTTFTTLNASGTYVPTCLAVFQNRLFGGRIQESDRAEDYRQRIRWSDVGVDNFDTWGSGSYIDLPYFNGAILRLIPYTNMLLVMAEDAIWYGVYQARANNPLAYNKISSSVGLVGMKAALPWTDGVFFVGQDNVYYFSNRGGLQKIGDAVIKKTIDECQERWRIYVAPDPRNNRIVFGFPKSSSEIQEQWGFNLNTGAWSYDPIGANSLHGVHILDQVTWADLSGLTWATIADTYPTWGSMASSGFSNPRLYFSSSDRVYEFQDGGTLDLGSISPVGYIETPDVELDAPQFNKSWHRVSVKISEAATSDIQLTVHGSIDRGNTWKSLGTLTISSGADEGKIDFRLLGDQARFKFQTTGNAVNPYTITQFGYRVKLRSTETTGRLG